MGRHLRGFPSYVLSAVGLANNIRSDIVFAIGLPGNIFSDGGYDRMEAFYAVRWLRQVGGRNPVPEPLDRQLGLGLKI